MYMHMHMHTCTVHAKHLKANVHVRIQMWVCWCVVSVTKSDFRQRTQHAKNEKAVVVVFCVVRNNHYSTRRP